MKMKNILFTLCLLMTVHWAVAQKSASISKETAERVASAPVAIMKKGSFQVATENLRKTTPSGFKIAAFRLIKSKDGKYYFLVQEVSSPKGKFNRYLPLAKKDDGLYVNMSRESSFVECWLMTCSTCEEVVSGTGGVWCECSVGGCENADTSDPFQDIVEYVTAY